MHRVSCIKRNSLSKIKVSGVALAVALATSGCSQLSSSLVSSQKPASPSRSADYLVEGTISFSRPVPHPSEAVAQIMAFMPIAPQIPDFGVKRLSSSETWVFVDSYNKSLEINRGDENILTVDITPTTGIAQGKFAVALKEENALWYASEEYFTKRNQIIPADGSSDRYRQGALGDFAVFLSGGLVIHSSPLFDDSVAGFQVSPDEIRSIYSLLEPGTKVIIR